MPTADTQALEAVARVPLTCPRCDGSGYEPCAGDLSDKACFKCGGDGTTADFDPHPRDPECWQDHGNQWDRLQADRRRRAMLSAQDDERGA